jgi:hypothetical protein
MTTMLLSVVAAFCSTDARADRAATSSEREGIETAIHGYWCSYLPPDVRPCTRWSLTDSAIRISTAPGRASWGFAHLTARSGFPANDEISTAQNLFLHKAHGRWSVTGWFRVLNYDDCSAASRGTHVPLVVLQDFGLCAQLIPPR